MPIITRLGGGGSPLNFKVTAYASLPASGKENEIAVITETPMTGWVMQNEEPTASEGFVWLAVGEESDGAFYADKKQYVKIYPKDVKQYVGGAWTNCEAWIYLNGSWACFSTKAIILYKYGSVGSASSWLATTNGTTAGGIDSFAEDAGAGGLSVTCAGGGSNARGGDLYIAEMQDLTEVSTLKMKIKRTASATTAKLWLFANSSIYNDRNSAPTFDASTLVTDNYSDFTEVSVSVESISGSKYVGVFMNSPSGTTQTNIISEFYME